jgi:hypothetical protein
MSVNIDIYLLFNYPIYIINVKCIFKPIDKRTEEINRGWERMRERSMGKLYMP